MKRFIFALMTVICVISMVSCSDNSEESVSVYEKGSFDGVVYKSEWADVKYTVSEGMNVLSEEDTYLLMGLTMAEIEGKEEIESEKLDTVYELYGSSTDGSMVIINTFKNIDTTAKIAEMKVEFDGKANDLLKPSYTDETVVTYGGIEFTRLDVTASAPDFVMYQTYLLKDVDEHVFCVSAAAFTKERVEELLGGISQYK